VLPCSFGCSPAASAMGNCFGSDDGEVEAVKVMARHALPQGTYMNIDIPMLCLQYHYVFFVFVRFILFIGIWNQQIHFVMVLVLRL
jgi:hypothetical protein